MKDLPRYAIYFTPPSGSPLERFGAETIGYDAYTGAVLPPNDSSPVTGEPRRYGFHATLKAPMRLRADADEASLLAAVRAFARPRSAVSVGLLDVSLIGSFVALTPSHVTSGLLLLAAECVATFDAFREPLSADDRARRVTKNLGERQMALLDRWGYPYVFDEFRFHMTLTGSLTHDERDGWRERLSTAYAPMRHQAVIVDALSLLRQDDPESSFRVVERIPLQG
jgi:putative phosphonate metabolism protein